MGDGGLGMGDWGLAPTPNPQSPIPNPQSPIPIYFIFLYNINLNLLKNKKIVLFYEIINYTFYIYKVNTSNQSKNKGNNIKC